MWKEYSLPFGADGFAARGHTRSGIPRSGGARFFRGYDGVFKPSSWGNFCAPTSEEAFIQARIYYGTLKSSSLYSLTTINEKINK